MNQLFFFTLQSQRQLWRCFLAETWKLQVRNGVNSRGCEGNACTKICRVRRKTTDLLY